MDISTKECLNELLQLKDEQVERLQEELNSIYDERDEQDWKWARHRVDEDHIDGLPIPRVQFKLTEDCGYQQKWELALIQNTYGDHHRAIPLSGCTRSGGELVMSGDTLPEHEVCSYHQFSRIFPLGITDFTNFVEQFPGIPAYVVINNHIWVWENGNPVLLKRINITKMEE